MRRLNIELPDSVNERMIDLRENLGATSLTEVIRRALAITESVVEHELAGGKVLLEAEDGSIRQLVIR